MSKNFSVDIKKVGVRIQQARKGLGLTQEAAADRTELSPQYWSHIETGRDCGSVSTYLQMATAVGLTVNDLFYDDCDLIRAKPSPAFEGVAEGLSEYEKQVLLRVMNATKDALIRSRDLL
jgi:Predicted transcriptional regulators